MKRQRRTKRELEWMNNECRLYLLSNGLDPHKAYEAIVKDHLISGTMIPYYIKGIKDFIKVSEELKQELNRIEQTKRRNEDKSSTIDKLKQITPEQYKTEILPKMKQTDNKKIKMVIADLWFYVNREHDFKYMTEEDIRTLKLAEVI